jgi:hypothetical protein
MLCIAIPCRRWLVQLPTSGILHAQDADIDSCVACILVVTLGGCSVYYVWEPRAFMTPPKNPLVYERLYVIPLYTNVFRFKYMFNVSIREYFSVLNVFNIVCIRNTARSKSIPLLCTHVDSYKFSTVHPPSGDLLSLEDFWMNYI